MSVEDVKALVEMERAMDRGEQPHITCNGGRWAFPGEILEALGLATGETVSPVVLRQVMLLNLRRVQELIAERKVAELVAET